MNITAEEFARRYFLRDKAVFNNGRDPCCTPEDRKILSISNFKNLPEKEKQLYLEEARAYLEKPQEEWLEDILNEEYK